VKVFTIPHFYFKIYDMKKLFFLLLSVITVFTLFGCSGESFSDIKINAEDVIDVEVGEYTLRYSIDDYEKYNEKYSLDVQVIAFDGDGKTVEVINNRTINIEADGVYSVSVMVSAVIDGKLEKIIKTYTVSAVKNPRTVTFFVGSKEYKKLTVKYGDSLDIDDFSYIPDMYTLTGSGVKQVIKSKKWVCVVDGIKEDLNKSHLTDIKEDVVIKAEYVYSVTYTDITVSFVNGEGATETPSITQLAGQVISRPEFPTRAGYIFDGWYKDAEYKERFSWNSYSTTFVLTDTVLYAKWLSDDTQNFTQYFDFTLYEDNLKYPYYGVSLKRDSDYPLDITVPVGYQNVPVKKLNKVSDGVRVYGAFQETNITSVVLPAELAYSDLRPFSYCNNLSSVTFNGSALTVLETGAFEGCGKLTEITLPEGITVINTDVFKDCSALEKIVLPSTLKTIGESVFENCVALQNIVIPDAVTAIYAAFSGCSSLSEVTIGEKSKLNYLGKGTFEGCVSLKEITLPHSFESQTSTADVFGDIEITINYYPPQSEEE